MNIGNGPLRLLRGALPDRLGGGACIVIVLPNGDRRLWRPQQQDMMGMYTVP